MRTPATPPAGWEDARVPERSRLAPLEPIGVRTALIESLCSYLMRLAASHRLTPGVLILESLGPAIGRSHPYEPLDIDGHYFSRFLDASPWSVNGRNEAARLFVAALEALTLRVDLAHLTMLPWARVLAAKGLLRREQAFCPICLAEWKAAGSPIYYPLIWSLSANTSCGVHGIELTVRCPAETCAAPQVPLTFWSVPGQCSRLECGAWLGADPERIEDDHRRRRRASDWGVWVAREVGELLAAPHPAAPVTGAGIREAMCAIVDETTDGNGARFGRLIGAPKSLVSQWRSGQVLPGLPHALRICAVGDCRLVDFVSGRVVRSDRAYDGDLPTNPEVHHPVLWEAFRLALVGALAERDARPPTLESLLAQFGADRRAADDRFGNLCRAVITAGERYRERRAREGAARLATEVRNGVERLRAAGIAPGKGRVQTLVGFQIRSGAPLEAWREATGGPQQSADSLPSIAPVGSRGAGGDR